MERNYIDIHLMADRYVLGALSQAEEAEFEERLLWDRDLADEVDLAMQLRDGLKASVAESSSLVVNDRHGFLDWLDGFFAQPKYAAAASFLFAVTLATSVVLNLPEIGSVSPGDSDMPTQFIAMPVTRSGTGGESVAVNEKAWVVLVVELDNSRQYPAYRATIRRSKPAGEIVWMQDDIRPNYLNTLALGMPGSELAPGNYVITLEGIRRSADGSRVYQGLPDLHFDSSITE